MPRKPKHTTLFKMIVLTEDKKQIYKNNFETDMEAILGDYGIDFETNENSSTIFESQKVSLKNAPGGAQRQNYNTVVSLKALQEKHFANLYVGLIDDPNYDLKEILGRIIGVAVSNNLVEPRDSNAVLILHMICNCIAQNWPKLVRYPTTRNKKFDYKLDTKGLIQAEKDYINERFLSNKKLYKVIGMLKMEYGRGTLGQEKLNDEALLEGIEIYRESLRTVYRDALNLKFQKLQKADDECSQLRASMFNKRTSQLVNYGFSKEECDRVLLDEGIFYTLRAKIQTKPLRSCELLESFGDDECVANFGFNKLEIKYLSTILVIPQNLYSKSQKSGRNTTKTIKTFTSHNPVVHFMVFLFRMHNRDNLFVARRVLGINKSLISKISKNVSIHITESFGYLLNINNCVYNDKYLRLLVDKSYTTLPGVKPLTTYMIDGTHTKISKPTKRKSVYEPSFNGSKSSDAVSFQYLADNMGMFIDVTKADLGSKNDITLLNESGLPQRLSKLKFGDDLLQVVGDSAYVGGSPKFNNETKMFEFDKQAAPNLYGVPKRSHVRKMGGEARASQRNISKVRCSIERAFGARIHAFKSLQAKDRQKLFHTFVSRENEAITLLSNLRQIMKNSATSAPLSDVLPPDLYLYMWGALRTNMPRSP